MVKSIQLLNMDCILLKQKFALGKWRSIVALLCHVVSNDHKEECDRWLYVWKIINCRNSLNVSPHVSKVPSFYVTLVTRAFPILLLTILNYTLF